MPDELLQYVLGPTPYSSRWLWLALALSAALLTWYTVVFIATMPHPKFPVVGAVRDRLVKGRSAGAVRRIGKRYRVGDLDRVAAAAAVSRELREFLHRTTGVRVQHMQLSAIADSELAPAAPILADLGDIQFNMRSTLDMGAVSASTEELISAWN